jgi:hypothetical protein
MDGAVIIRVRHEEWEVIQEFNSEHYPISIVYGPLGNFKVEKSPILELV